jgi:hypothetical protein
LLQYGILTKLMEKLENIPIHDDWKRRRMAMHIESILRQRQIPVLYFEGTIYNYTTILDTDGRRYIQIRKTKSLFDYVASLHEIGHYVLKHTGSNKSNAVREIEAWDWTYENSLVQFSLKEKILISTFKYWCMLSYRIHNE